MIRLFIVIILFITTELYGQNDTIFSILKDYEHSKSELILKSRRLILDKFIEGDYQKVKEIKDYLTLKVEDEDYLTLYPGEYWLILYWTQEYKNLLESFQHLLTPQSSDYQRKIAPQDDFLFDKLRSKSRESRPLLEVMLNNSELENVEKDFLKMHLTYMLSGYGDTVITQDTLNLLADEYLSNYSDSIYNDFTRKYIRYKFIPSKWGFAFEFFSGYSVFTENLALNYRNNVPIGVAFDVSYKNFILYLRDYIGFSKIKIDRPYEGGIWEEGSQVRVFLPEASIGYAVMENNRLKIAPFAGIAATDISPTEYDLRKEPDLKEVGLVFTTTYTLGLNVDIKLGTNRIPMLGYGPEQNYGFIRLRYAYNSPKFDKKYNGFGGNMHYLTIGIGGFTRKTKRDY